MRHHWEGIVLHHSATPDSPFPDVISIRRHHKEVRGWRDIGYQWLVEKIGGTYLAVMGRPSFIPEGAHCPGKNRTHLGICFVGNFEEERMDPEQVRVGVDLIASLCALHGIEPSSISLHRHWRATDCPGSLFPFDSILTGVIERLGPQE